MSGSSLSIGTDITPVDLGAETARENGAVIQRRAGAQCRELIARRREEWLAALKMGKGGAVDLHPDLLGPACGEQAVILFSEANEEGGGMRFAALAGQQISLRILARPRVRVRMGGHRLIGSEIVGCASALDRHPFIDRVFELVAGRETECVMLDDLEAGSAMHETVVSRAGLDRRIMLHQPSATQARWWIDFPADASEYWKKFSKKTRETLRSRVRKLGHEVVKFTSVDEVPAFLRLAEEISKTSWQAKRMGLRISDSEDSRAYWGKVAGIGAFRSYVLRQGERPIAFMVGRQWEGRFYYEEAGYDLEFAKQSPGTVLQIRVIEDLIEHDTPQVLDFSFGDGEHKRMFGNRQTSSAAVLVLRRSWRNSALAGLHRASAGAVARFRSWGVYKYLRRAHRG
jgi:hypothetical protein